MIDLVQYGYLILSAPFILLWAVLYLFSKKTRREQLFMSLLSLPLGPLSELVYTRDYWSPPGTILFHLAGFPIMLEDLLFVFCVGGIAGVLYEALGKYELQKLKLVHKTVSLTGLVIFGILFFVVLSKMGVNSIFASSAMFVIVALGIILQRRDLAKNAALSGLLFAAVVFISYKTMALAFPTTAEEFLSRYWFLYGTRYDSMLFGVPITELLWAYGWGMVAGPMYEFVKGYRLRSIAK